MEAGAYRKIKSGMLFEIAIGDKVLGVHPDWLTAENKCNEIFKGNVIHKLKPNENNSNTTQNDPTKAMKDFVIPSALRPTNFFQD